MSDSTVAPSIRVIVPDGSGSAEPLAAMRLGAYREDEAAWIDTSIQLGDGFYMMTSGEATANVDGVAFVYGGQGMLVKGDKSITWSDAGETAVRAQTVSFAADCSPSTSGGNVNLDASDDVTMESGADISVTCKNLVYVIEEHLHGSTASAGTSVAQGEISVNVGLLCYISPMADIDIATLGFEMIGFEHSASVFSLSSAGAEMSKSSFENANKGMRAFLVGMFIPFEEAEAEEHVSKNENVAVRAHSLSVGAEENGARNEINAVAVRARALSCNF